MIENPIELLMRLIDWRPSTPAELAAWQSEALVLLEFLSKSPLDEDGTPEIVIHYLNDADIRFRDMEYAIAQECAISEFAGSMRTRLANPSRANRTKPQQ